MIFHNDKMGKRNKYKILVAEDNLVNVKVAEFVLKPIADVLDFVMNGQEVLDKIRTNTYDFILMDVEMPIMDGYEATQIIRKQESLNKTDKRIKIIASTANNQPEEVTYCKSIGMDELIVKPFNTKDILSIIEILDDL